jgi:probable phosphoglycerate mutase
MTTTPPAASGHITTVILVRHAESTWNAESRWQGQADPPLSETGRAQAQHVARRLRSEPIAALYSSDLGRALETAQAIGQALGLLPRPEPRLREIDLGLWAGMTRFEIAERYPEEFVAWQEHKPVRAGGGETFLEMQERVVGVLDEIVAAHPGETIAVVTHGGVVTALRSHIQGMPMSAELFEGVPPNRNTALTIVRYHDGRPEITLLMDASHLPGDGA